MRRNLEERWSELDRHAVSATPESDTRSARSTNPGTSKINHRDVILSAVSAASGSSRLPSVNQQ